MKGGSILKVLTGSIKPLLLTSADGSWFITPTVGSLVESDQWYLVREAISQL
jgi:hypothetical protein